MNRGGLLGVHVLPFSVGSARKGREGRREGGEGGGRREMASPLALLYGCGTGLLVLLWVGVLVARAARLLWWTPRRLEKLLRQQGISGSGYRFPFGDIREQMRMNKEAQSKAMPLSHDVTVRLFPWIRRDIEKHGDISFSWIGPHPQVLIKDPQLVREILSDKSGAIIKSKINPLGKLLVTGVATYEGEKWARHRRIINRAFQMEKLKLMSTEFLICCTELINRWEQSVSVDESCELDVWPEFQNFAGDVISRTAFGTSYLQGRRIFQLQAEQTLHLMQSFQHAIIPGYRFLPTKRNRRMKEIYKEVMGLLSDLVTEREKGMQLGTAKNDDLLGLLLESNKHHCEENENDKRFRMTTEDVIEECRLFYFAGQETTSVLLTWTMIVLSMHQDWQARAREEVLQVFGGGKPEFESLNQLKVVTMILNEVLRLYPPAPFIIRSVKMAMKLGEFKIPAGVNIFIPIIYMHHDPEMWGEDAHEFNPERFAEGVSKASKNPTAYLPFSGGPRICLGQNFSMVEAKFCLAMILQRFAFELSPSYSHAPHQNLTLQAQHGAQIILHKL